jgi:hypothetical protein
VKRRSAVFDRTEMQRITALVRTVQIMMQFDPAFDRISQY